MTDAASSDPLSGPAAPVVDAARAAIIARDCFGIAGQVTVLGSQSDANFRVDADGRRYVLKLAHPGADPAHLTVQDDAAAHVAARVSGVLVPHTHGRARVDGLDARLLDYLDGPSLGGDRYLAPEVVASLGSVAVRVGTALADFDHPGLDRPSPWDLLRAVAVVERLADHAPDPAGVLAATRAADVALAPLLARLPRQAVHGDLTDDNVVAAPGADRRLHPVGVIDFGDVVRSVAVGELAVTLSCVLHHAGARPTSVLPAVRAWHAARPLHPDEIDALWPLVVLRAAVLVVSSRAQAAVDGDNAYVADRIDGELRIFQQATAVPLPVMTAWLRAALGRPGPAPEPPGPSLVDVALEVVDLGSTSPLLDAGRWLEPGVETALLTPGTATRYGEARLTRSRLRSPQPPDTVALCIDAHLPPGTPVRMPAGRVETTPTGVVVHEGAAHCWIDGVTGGPDRWYGERIRMQRSTLQERPPPFVPADLASGWAAVAPDPSALLGLAEGGTGSAAGLLDRRAAVLAEVQEHYYADPPRVERGWRDHLVDVDARAHLDMVNNVASIGHGRPELADAVARQWRLLNTNSRFHYGAVVEFAERLAGLLPDPLDTVFLVNSGSEAVDLALRLAWVTTGRRDVVAVREAYHGWTDATDAVSTSVADNPAALETRPPWVHTVAAPNSYRGEHRGDDAWRYAVDAVGRLDALAADGRPAAAFLAEAYYGNAGGMPLPDGYLAAVYAAVRRHGGLAIADEVQVGYGRLGDWFWGFEQQGVVPDVVAVAKAMGNGHPLGAVVTTRAVAAAYRRQGYFFSSAGGSPVSSVVGLTVLDVIDRERLQDNARAVGAHLRGRLLELAERHPLIGAVHGTGLYLGVEFVRDADLTPATEETAAICARMLDLGVVIQPTSDRLCVLKIKPPLVIDRAGADHFADMLDRVLTEGW